MDLLDVSTGGPVRDAKIPAWYTYQVPFAAQARDGAGIPTAAAGLVIEPEQTEEVVASGEADAVMLGPQLLRKPYRAHHAATDLGDEARRPQQYGYAVVRRPKNKQN